MLFQTIAWLLLVDFNVHADPTVLPETQRLHYPGSAAMKCVFATPLTACFIRVSEHRGDSFDKLLDFSSGVRSPSNVSLDETYMVASYYGYRLDINQGECGVRVDVNITGVLFIECFGRTEEGQWDRGMATMSTQHYRVLPVTFETPLVQVVAPGSNLSMLLRADRKLGVCYFTTPSTRTETVYSGRTLQTGIRFQKYGGGPDNKECGFTLLNLQEADAGIWLTWAEDGVNSLEFACFQETVVIVQAVPVGEPVLAIKDADRLVPGKILEAKCVAPPAVPHGNLTWLLGGHVVRQDNLNDTLPEEIGTSRPWHRQPLVQTFRRLLTEEDMGKELECRMDHVALAGPRTVAHKLPVHGGNVTAEHAIVRTSVGHRSKLVCQVHGAGPNTTVRWTRAGVSVKESHLVRVGNNDTCHWMILENTATEDFATYTCSARDGPWTLTQDFILTGLPGTPEWTGNESTPLLSWRVESVAPITSSKLHVRQGTGPWQEFTEHTVKIEEPGWHLVTFTDLSLPPGTYTVYLSVANKHGVSEASQFQNITFDVSPCTLATSQETDAPTATPRPIGVRADTPVIRTAVGYQAELVCIVEAVPDATVQWSRAGVPVEESGFVVTGNDGDRHWLRLEETTAEDLTEFTCNASNGEGSASKVIQLTGLPGTPQFASNASPSQLAWLVESAVPLIGYQLKIRRGKRQFVDFKDIEVTEPEEGWQLVTLKQLPVLPGRYTAILQVENEFGSSEVSPFHNFTVASEATTSASVADSGARCTCAKPPVSTITRPAPVAPSLTKNCGLAVAGGVGGSQEAVEGQFPWHAALYTNHDTDLEPLCAATLISRRHLLTAAHCVSKGPSDRQFEAGDLFVTLGSTSRARANASTAKLLAVESVHVNRWYRGSNSFIANLAVLRLRDKVQESVTVRRACVDWRNTTEHQDLRMGRTAQLATWGAANQSTLRWLDLTYTNESACVGELDYENLAYRYNQDSVCAEYLEERHHCAEDAGAGLVFRDTATQRHYVRGVASVPFTRHRYDRGCSHKNWLSGFTKLSAHLQWLESILLAG